MKAEKKEAKYDVVITMTSEQAIILKEAFGEKTRSEDDEYYGNEQVHEVLYELFRTISKVVD